MYSVLASSNSCEIRSYQGACIQESLDDIGSSIRRCSMQRGTSFLWSCTLNIRCMLRYKAIHDHISHCQHISTETHDTFPIYTHITYLSFSNKETFPPAHLTHASSGRARLQKNLNHCKVSKLSRPTQGIDGKLCHGPTIE